MAALKHQIDAALGRRLAAELVAAWPGFPHRRFTSGLAGALEPLELLARVGELADRLSRALPAEFPAAAEVLWRCLDSWAPRLNALVVDPAPNLPLLDALADDPSPYVRRSVANHLNDIAKDHPALALEVANRWLSRDCGAWTARHSIRTLIKRGDPQALELAGVTVDADIRLLELAVERDHVPLGEAAAFEVTLELASGGPADVVVDYRVHYVGARGMKAPRVFKLARRRLAPGRPVTIRREHAFDHVSIRRIHPGRHVIDIQVNGRILGSAAVEITN